MTAFSLGTVWEETIAFIRRESGLLLPVAFATFGVAQLLLELGMGGEKVGAAKMSGSPVSLLVFPAMLVMLIGNLAVTRLVLQPGTSVGESLSAALRRIPIALLVLLIVSLVMIAVAFLVAIIATVGAMAAGADPKAAIQTVLTFLTIPMFIVAIRLMLLIPVLAMEPLGAMASLRKAWALSKSHFARLTGLFLLILLVTLLLGVIQLFVVGSVFKLLTLAIGSAEFVTVLEAVVSAAIASLLSLAVTLYVALVYRRVALIER